MSDDAKLAGRKAALGIVQKIHKSASKEQAPLSLEGLTAAIDRIAEGRPDLSEPMAAIASPLGNIKHEAADLSPIVKALSGLELTSLTEVDMTAVAKAIADKEISVDLTVVERELKGIHDALKRNNDVLAELVAAAKMSKTVVYDAAGRIVEIKTS